MVKELLVGLSSEAPDAGRRLLERLDEAHLQVTDAFWWFVEEETSWRLILATSLVYNKGPIELYTTIRKALDQMTEDEKAGMLLGDTALVAPDNSVVQLMRYSYGPIGEGRRQSVRRISVTADEPFIYRLQSVEAK